MSKIEYDYQIIDGHIGFTFKGSPIKGKRYLVKILHGKNYCDKR